MKQMSTAALTLAAVCAAGSAWADGEKIALFTKNQTNPFFQTVRVAAEDAAKQMHATISNYVPTKPDSIPEQMSQVEDAVTKHPDAVVFTPVDFKAMGPALQKLNAAKIPVINITDRASGGEVVTFIGSDDYNLGLATGRYLLKKMNGEGRVIILEGVRGSVTSQERVRGFNKALEEFPKVKLLASQPGNYQRLQAMQVTENLLQAHPKIDGVMAANDAMAMGVIEALDGADRKALVVSINATKEGVDAVKAGKLLATGDYNGFLQGCLGTLAAIRHLRKQSVPKEIVFPASVIDASNYKGHEVPDNQRTCPKWEQVVKG
jgi:ribose transport system substrate-binding protein